MKKHYKIALLIVLSCCMLLFATRIADYRTDAIFVKNENLVVALPSGNKSYFIQNGQVLGYQYEMIKEYAKSINRTPLFVLENDINKRLNLLKQHKVDIAVCDNLVDSIKTLSQFFTSKKINPSLMQTIWAVDNRNIALDGNINNWLGKFEKQREYKGLNWRYYEKKIPFEQTEYLSDYDDLIKKYSEKIDWDWRLVASLIYQESKFKTSLQSHTGATGLMQVRPQTASFLKTDGDIYDVETNIAVGTKLIKYLENKFMSDSTIQRQELVKFVLAAYNSGHGKIESCQRYAKKQDLNPLIWKEVEFAASPRYTPKYDSIAKPKLSKETRKFVSEVLTRYEHYKNFFDAYQGDTIQNPSPAL